MGTTPPHPDVSAEDEERQLRVVLTEFERLRAEIDSRTQLQSGVLVAGIAALGFATPLVHSLPEALPGIAVVLSILWLLWMDHADTISKLGAYIHLRLRPVAARLVRGPVLQWEAFLRRLDAGGLEAQRILEINEEGDFPSLGIRYVTRYVSGYFGIASAALLLAFAITTYVRLTSSPLRQYGSVHRHAFAIFVAAHVVEGVIASVVVASAAWRHRRLRRLVEIITEAIVVRGGEMASPAAGPPRSEPN